MLFICFVCSSCAGRYWLCGDLLMPPPGRNDSGFPCFMFEHSVTTGTGEFIVVCPPLGQTNKLSVQFKTPHVYSSLKVKCILLILYFEDPPVSLVVAGQFGGKACDWSIARTGDWSLHGGGRPETPPPPSQRDNVLGAWA